MLFILALALGANPGPYDHLDSALLRARDLLRGASKEDASCIRPKIELMEATRVLIRPIDLAQRRALDEGNQLHADAEGRKLAVINGKVDEYLRQAEACIEVQATSIRVGDPPALAGEDALWNSEPPPELPCVSCS